MRNLLHASAAILMAVSACGPADETRGGGTGGSAATGGASGDAAGGTSNTGSGGAGPTGGAGTGVGGASEQTGGSTGTEADGGAPDGGGTGGAAGGTGDPASFTVMGLATWKYDDKAAYTIIHDDVGNYPSITTFVVDEMGKRGLGVGLGCIVGVVAKSSTETERLKGAILKGHEVLSHSYNHVEVHLSNANQEVTIAHSKLEEIFGSKVTFFIYPYDFRDPGVAKIVAEKHLGDRSGWSGSSDNKKGVNPKDFDDYDTAFETSGQDNTPPGALNDFVDDTIAAGGWGQRELHGIGDGSYNHVSKDEYTKHMDYLKTKWDAGELWTAPPSAVIKYKHLRQGACGEPSASGNVIKFSAVTAPDCVKYATPVSINVQSAAQNLQASQGGKMLEVVKRGDHFAITADPTAGDVTVTE
jgi:hypothetical protein